MTFERYAASEEQKVTDVADGTVEVEWKPVFKYFKYDGEEEEISDKYITGTPFATAQLKILPRELAITVSPVAAEQILPTMGRRRHW